jgi:choline dehydrogenase-like flavoprotein
LPGAEPRRGLKRMHGSDIRESDTREADVIVVGAGSAGAALAARLSEDAWRRVLLIEAGRDTAPGQVPADIRNIFPAAYINGEYFWPGLTTSYRKDEAPIPFLQPRVMGGGSSVMGMIALRGLPSDYDAWEEMGARNWSWRDVLPAFQAMTDDRDATGPGRNVRGPNIVRRLPRASWPAYMHRLEEALAARGVPSHANIYETDDDGFFPTPLSQDHERATSARCYLTAEVRARPNLDIMCDTRLLRVLFDGRRVTGILAERAGERKTIAAREVVISAGGIHSPALLLRSGIGPAEDLRKLGIAVVADRRGVGRNYQNHPQLHFAMPLKPASRMPASAQHYIMTSQRFSSGLPGCARGDLFHYYTGRVSTRSFGPRIAMLAACLYTPVSRGSVSLRSADPSVPPVVQQCLLADPLDAKRMIMSVRHAERLLLEPAVRQCFEEIYLMPRQAPLKLINGTGVSGLAKAVGATAVLAAPAPLRRAMIGTAIKPGRLVAGDAAAKPISDEEILDATGASFHPTSTCAIGAERDPMAVVDPYCRVYGVEGLRVADASVMPKIVSANTNMPTIMIAERVAEFMRTAY